MKATEQYVPVVLFIYDAQSVSIYFLSPRTKPQSSTIIMKATENFSVCFSSKNLHSKIGYGFLFRTRVDFFCDERAKLKILQSLLYLNPEQTRPQRRQF